MSAEFGSSFGLSSAGRVDLGSIALPTKLTHFVWVMRLGAVVDVSPEIKIEDQSPTLSVLVHL